MAGSKVRDIQFYFDPFADKGLTECILKHLIPKAAVYLCYYHLRCDAKCLAEETWIRRVST